MTRLRERTMNAPPGTVRRLRTGPRGHQSSSATLRRRLPMPPGARAAAPSGASRHAAAPVRASAARQPALVLTTRRSYGLRTIDAVVRGVGMRPALPPHRSLRSRGRPMRFRCSGPAPVIRFRLRMVARYVVPLPPQPRSAAVGHARCEPLAPSVRMTSRASTHARPLSRAELARSDPAQGSAGRSHRTVARDGPVSGRPHHTTPRCRTYGNCCATCHGFPFGLISGGERPPNTDASTDTRRRRSAGTSRQVPSSRRRLACSAGRPTVRAGTAPGRTEIDFCRPSHIPTFPSWRSLHGGHGRAARSRSTSPTPPRAVAYGAQSTRRTRSRLYASKLPGRFTSISSRRGLAPSRRALCPLGAVAAARPSSPRGRRGAAPKEEKKTLASRARVT